MSFRSGFSGLVKNITGMFGYELRKIQLSIANTNKAESHPEYLRNSEASGLDVNDYQEIKLGFLKPIPLLENCLFPVINKFTHPEIIELGPGTGRWTRHVIDYLNGKNGGGIVLADHSEWILEFLKKYFEKKESNSLKLRYELCDGYNLPETINDTSADIIFSANTFIAFGVYKIYTYSHDFFAKLRSGGYCIFDYIDIESEGGWNFLKLKTAEKLDYYTYHRFEAVNKIFTDAGFEFAEKREYGKSTFLTYKKT